MSADEKKKKAEKTKKNKFDYARAGLEIYSSEPVYINSDPTLSQMRVRGVVAAARSSKKPLTAEMRSVLEEAMSRRFYGIVKSAIADTKQAAEKLNGLLKKGSGVVAMGSSPEKVGFALESTGRSITYPSVSRAWLQSKSGEAAKKARFSELFAETLALVSPGGPCTELVFVDYADTFSTIFAVDAMLRKWHPDVSAKSRFVVMFDDQTNEVHLRTAEIIPGWTVLRIPNTVWSLSKAFRCNPGVNSKGGLTNLQPEDMDYCDAVRLLISPDYFSKKIKK